MPSSKAGLGTGRKRLTSSKAGTGGHESHSNRSSHHQPEHSFSPAAPVFAGYCIGPALAKRIVDFREKNHGFKRVEELLAVPGISQKKWNAIRDKVEVVNVTKR